MTPVRSARTSTTLFVLGGVFVWTALIVGGAARGILRSDVFARRLAATLSDERVANYVSARITDGIISQRPNLVGVRPLLQSAVSAVVTSAPFRAVVRTTARNGAEVTTALTADWRSGRTPTRLGRWDMMPSVIRA